LKLGKALGTDSIPNQFLTYFSRRLLVQCIQLHNQWLRFSNFPASWKEANIITLPMASKESKLHLICLLFKRDKLSEVILKTD
jgi:hypothetical protein